MNRTRQFILVLAVLLILLAWWRVWAARAGLVVRALEQDGLPMHYIAPADAQAVPGVLIAHGFAGSQQVMLGYAYTLAHAGYGVLLWDFGGHGANAGLLNGDESGLQAAVNGAYATLVAQPEIDPARVALLGHSMGSGAVMQAGVQDPDRYQATIAVSPTDAAVSADAPRNFLLLAGALEPRFAANAERLLAAAGGANDDFTGGRARALRIIPGVEHITILFTPASHRAALDWLNQTFGRQTADAYRDERIFWYGTHLAGWLLLATAVAPLIRAAPTADQTSFVRRPYHWLGLVVAPFLAAGLVALMNRLTPLSNLGGLLVGGALALWFLFLGLLWLAIGFRLSRPDGRSLLWGVVLFALLWLAFGALGHHVWLPWRLIPARLSRWVPLAAACLPWLLAAGLAQQGADAGQRMAWWLAQTICLITGLILAIYLTPTLSFLFLILPMLPITLAVMAIAGAAVDRPWAYAIGNALFFGWLLAAVFPLAG